MNGRTLERFARAALALVVAGCGARTGLEDPVATRRDAGADTLRDVATDDAAVDARRDAPPSPGAPRLLAPLSTATVTSQRPTLRWVLPAGATGARVLVCRDRACRQVLQDVTTSGTGVRLGSALAPGVYFWRCLATPAGSAPSATWEFTVGHRDAPHDTSHGTTLDLDGDGHADLAVGAGGAAAGTGRVYIYPGSATGLATAPATTLTGPDGAGGAFGGSVANPAVGDVTFDRTVASAGDVNGDGYGDLVVGAHAVLGRTGRAYVYHGGPGGIAATPTTVLTGPDGPPGHFGGAVASAGDVNADGYADLVVGAPEAATVGRAYVYLGGPTGLATAPAATLVTPDAVPGGYFGLAVASAHDANGDGYGDVVVGRAYGGLGVQGRAYVYLGGATGPATTPVMTLAGRDRLDGAGFGFSIAGAGDVDGDGYPDLIVGGSGGRGYVFLGGVAGLATVANATLPGPDRARFGAVVAGAGDLNGDGFGDVVVSGDANQRAGRADVFLGSPAGVGTVRAAALQGADGPEGLFGVSIAGAGDLDGDGYGDLVVGASGASGAAGRAYVFAGRATGLAVTPATTLTGPDGPGGKFGVSVAATLRYNSWSGMKGLRPEPEPEHRVMPGRPPTERAAAVRAPWTAPSADARPARWQRHGNGRRPFGRRSSSRFGRLGLGLGTQSLHA